MPKVRKISFVALSIALLTALYWYAFIALKESPMSQDEIVEAYEYQALEDIEMNMQEVAPGVFSFTFKSFDGEVVYGQISYPDDQSERYPVLIGISAMGRSYVRWWVDTYNGNPTVTQAHKITDLANSNGYAVISIDARYHGKRKDPNRPLRSIMNDLHFFGDKSYYEGMIRDTVRDHRVLLDWIDQQDNLDSERIKVAGYSMGGQISLILGSIEKRIGDVIAIVPPFIDDKIALVAPKNLVSLMKEERVLLVTASDDESASPEENDLLFSMISSPHKERIDFDGGHILPEEYVVALAREFESDLHKCGRLDALFLRFFQRIRPTQGARQRQV